MQAQDATENFLFKIWPWIEANLKQLIYGVTLVLIFVFAVSFYSWRKNQRQIEAGEALTQAMFSDNGSQLADACLKVAADYPGTRAAQRAQLQGATALFVAGKYTEAQTQFQKYLDAYPDSDFMAQATYGIGVCLDAQGKTDLAATQYQKTINQTSDPSLDLAAKFALATADERLGRTSDAVKLYQDVVRSDPNSSLATEASMRMIDLMSATTVHPGSTPAATANSLINLLNQKP